MKRVLYLGLDPSRWKGGGEIVHYPVIRTEPTERLQLHDWPLFTHLIFTSRSAVIHWDRFGGKQIVAIGEATAQLIREKGMVPRVAKEATQEGVIELLGSLDLKDAYLLWPRSERARGDLAAYLRGRKIRFLAQDLYRTVFQKLEPVPSLDEFDEIVFTSPSTVEGFLQIYETFPKQGVLTCIGPITRKVFEASGKKT